MRRILPDSFVFEEARDSEVYLVEFNGDFPLSFNLFGSLYCSPYGESVEFGQDRKVSLDDSPHIKRVGKGNLHPAGAYINYFCFSSRSIRSFIKIKYWIISPAVGSMSISGATRVHISLN